MSLTVLPHGRQFQNVTAEATRKILKKHAKRTALPLAPDLASPFVVHPDSTDGALVLSRAHPVRTSETLTLSLLLVQALTETLLPIIPHIDDYSCVICTSLAFKPIRLHCSHLFCVRCVVRRSLARRGSAYNRYSQVSGETAETGRGALPDLSRADRVVRQPMWVHTFVHLIVRFLWLTCACE